ncbi:MAG TPA: hypothetical protein VFV07_08160, partial [Rhizomicrobium sp.]|nr:hypothetical protein [Rhizomicrobium sp.]
MASATAVTTPPANGRQPSMLDTLFDVLANAAARFDQITGARVNAHALNAAAMPLIRKPLHVVDEINERARNAYEWGRNAAYLATHPRAAIHGIDTALRKSGHGRQLDNFYNDAGMAYHYGRKGYRAGRDLYKRYDAFINGKYPSQGTPLEKAAWDVHKLYEKISDFADAKDKAKKVREFVGAHWRKLHKDFPQAFRLYHEWKPAIKNFFRGPAQKIRRFMRAHPMLTRALVKGSEIGGKITGVVGRISDAVDKVANPILFGADVYNLWKDATAKKRDWGKIAGDAGQAAWDAYNTATAYGKKPLTWFFTKTQPGQWLARKGMGIAQRRIFPLVDRYIAPLARRYIAPAAERYLLPLAERFTVPVAERLAGKGLVGTLAALGVLAVGGGIYAYYHPKETKQFFHGIGDFFHNVGVDLTGTAKEKARSGSHPWADLTASTLKLFPDVFSGNIKGEMEDTANWKQAFDKLRPKAPLTVHNLIYSKDYQFARDSLSQINPGMPSLDDVRGGMDFMKQLWEPAKTSQPRTPAPVSRNSTRLHAPISGRSPQSRRQSAANIPTKTQAEIRVRFD